MRQILLFTLLLLSICEFLQAANDNPVRSGISSLDWNGDVNMFTFGADEEIQFFSPEAMAGYAYINAPVTFSSDMTWEIDVKLDFKPTNSNNLRIMVYAYKDITIYIQVGNNGGQISLYRQEGDKAAKVCISGRKYLLLDQPFTYTSIRLTLEDYEQWTLYTKKENEKNYTSEGTCIGLLNTLTPNNLFGLTCRYIKSRLSDFYIRNIKISNKITPEPEAESEISDVKLVDIELAESGHLKFIFDNPVDISRAVCEIDGMGNATRVSYGESNSTIVVGLPQPLEKENEYYITWHELYDLKGRLIDDLSMEVYFEEDDLAPPPVTGSGEIRINEIMADPKGAVDLPETEYIELFNMSGEDVSLKDWVLIYDSREVVLNDVLLPAEKYIVLYREGRDIHINEGGLTMPLPKFPSALANNGKTVSLIDPFGEVKDETAYPKAKAGISWERSEDGNWYLSVDKSGGTPGSINSETIRPEPPGEGEEGESDVRPGEIVFNELLPDPYAGGSEYIELYNRSDRTLSLKELAIGVRKPDGTINKFYFLSGVTYAMPSHSYILLTKNKLGVESFYMVPFPDLLFEVNLPVLANTSSTLLLCIGEEDTIIDEITYSSKWHTPSIKETKGVAIERIDPEGETQASENWTSATFAAGYGTPGYQNSQYAEGQNGNSTYIEAPVYATDGLYHIAYQLDNTGYNCRAYVYNVGGYRVAQLANHELMGVSGEMKWDGKASDGIRLRAGVFIFYAELYHKNGTIKRYKKVFLIR